MLRTAAADNHYAKGLDGSWLESIATEIPAIAINAQHIATGGIVAGAPVSGAVAFTANALGLTR